MFTCVVHAKEKPTMYAGGQMCLFLKRHIISTCLSCINVISYHTNILDQMRTSKNTRRAAEHILSQWSSLSV